MYLHLGNNVVVPKDSVVCVFDLDISSQSRRTRDFLAAAEKAGIRSGDTLLSLDGEPLRSQDDFAFRMKTGGTKRLCLFRRGERQELTLGGNLEN